MRKPKTPGHSAAPPPAPPGGRALGRARQFAQSRGLPAPAVDPPPATPARTPRKARKPPRP